MTTSEQTIFANEEKNEQQGTAQTSNKHQAWKPVSIGGVSGILMGAAAMYAADSFATSTPSSDDATTADEAAGAGQHTTSSADIPLAEVDQSLSFGDAFAAARAQVGAGGVFVWHGNLYNTFTAEEWQGMDAGQKHDFAQGVAPMVSQTEQAATQTTTTHTQTSTVQQTEEHITIDEGQGQDAHVRVVSNEEPEVHFLGVSSQQTEEGLDVNVGTMSVNGVQVALVDIDNDQVFDFMGTDRNQNGRFDIDEIEDIEEAGITVQDFAARVQAEQAEHAGTGYTDTAMNQHDDLAPEMPDYMNDADVSLV